MGEFSVRSFNGPKLGSESPSPSHEKSRELRRLESDFPGLERDENVSRIFADPDSGRIEIWRADVEIQEAPTIYYLRGDEDYLIDVAKHAEAKLDLQKKEKMPALSRSFYEVVRITRM